ncbi:MAG: ABC transporter substrate-binding protein [Tistlia sp.]|uniref:ABC transporter substrate-binding protein n=1 Tax=Tistlia sp. TaxID=3057121 RepID=UPI0034A13761
MRKTLLFGTLVAAGLSVALGQAASAAELTPVTIAIGTKVLDTSQANNTSVPLATECWKKEGLDVSFQPTNSTAAMQAVLAGQADFVLMGPGAAVKARAQGAPIKAVYMNMRKNFQFPVVEASSDIRSIEDFKGKTMGVVSYGAQMVAIFKGMLAEAGLDPDKDLTIVETGVGAQAVAALQTGQVDIWGTWDSQIATAENMGLELRRFTSPFADKLKFGSSYFVRDDYIEKEPETIAKVLRCVAQGTAIALENPRGVVETHWEVFPATKPSGVAEEEAFRQGLHILEVRSEFLVKNEDEQWGEFPPQAVADLVEFMEENGEIEPGLDPEDLYTNQFVEQVNDFDHDSIPAQAEALN